MGAFISTIPPLSPCATESQIAEHHRLVDREARELKYMCIGSLSVFPICLALIAVVGLGLI
jgi:hypothetical protein